MTDKNKMNEFFINLYLIIRSYILLVVYCNMIFSVFLIILVLRILFVVFKECIRFKIIFLLLILLFESIKLVIVCFNIVDFFFNKLFEL